MFSHAILSAITCSLTTNSSTDLVRSLKLTPSVILCCCVTDIRDWCSSRRLQLNALTTEQLWFISRANLRKLSFADLTLSVGNDVIQPVTVVRDLGVYLDNELTMKQHISRVVSSCFFQLRRMRQIRRSAGEEVTKRLHVTALVLSIDVDVVIDVTEKSENRRKITKISVSFRFLELLQTGPSTLQ